MHRCHSEREREQNIARCKLVISILSVKRYNIHAISLTSIATDRVGGRERIRKYIILFSRSSYGYHSIHIIIQKNGSMKE